MMRVVLALLVASILVGLAVVLIRAATRAVDRVGTDPTLATGVTMQKAAFFLLLCLIMYVSVSGGT